MQPQIWFYFTLNAPGALSLSFFRLRYLFVAALTGTMLLLAFPGYAGLVDFSAKLLSFVESKWGQEALPRLTTWQRLVRDTRPKVTAGDGKSDSLGLKRVNGFFNQIPYMSDMKHWNTNDYWATPVEFLGSFAGDCEDYSIAKFLSLKDIGIPSEKLRITYVRALNLGESHMVLAYYSTPDAEPLILDNLIGDIRPASERTDLEPVYSFNDDDLWLASGLEKKGGSSQVRLWKGLLEKLAREQGM